VGLPALLVRQERITIAILPDFSSTLAPRAMITASFADWSLSAGFTAVSWSLISRDNGPILVRRGVS
jgi:hypothetical protein